MIRDQFHETIVGLPPQGWTLGHVTLRPHGPDERVPIEAFRWNVFAVHESPVGFHLTHAPSGLCIYKFETAEAAAECAEKLLPLTDWSAIVDRVPGGDPLWPRVKAILQQFAWVPE